MGTRIGYGFSPNGLIPVVVDDGRPSSYDFVFRTSDGINISINVDSDNEARAETIRTDLIEKMAWTSVPTNSGADSDTVLNSIGYGLLVGVVSTLVAIFVLIFGAIIWSAAGFKPPVMFEEYDSFLHFAVRISIVIGATLGFGVFVTGIIGTIGRHRARRK